jgi:hypothetical protein
MDKQFYTTELLLTLIENTKEILNKLDNLDHSSIKKLSTKTDFNITTFKQASKKLNCSISTLRTAIKNNILQQDIHYKYNGRKKYLFSKSALEDIKGNL